MDQNFFLWNLSSGVLEIFMWYISKPDIYIWSPHKLDGGYVEGGSCVVSLVNIDFLIDYHQGHHSKFNLFIIVNISKLVLNFS